MLQWIALLFLVVIEAVGLKWWTSTQFRPLFFNDWAAFLYSALLAVDIIIVSFISTLFVSGGTPGMDLLLVIGIGLCVIVGLATLFFRWVVRLDMTDISKRDNRR
jgi:hypothetical protein